MTNSWFVVPTHEGKCFVNEWRKPGCPRAVVLQPCPRHAKGQAKLLQHTCVRIRAKNSLHNVCYHTSDKQLWYSWNIYQQINSRTCLKLWFRWVWCCFDWILQKKINENESDERENKWDRIRDEEAICTERAGSLVEQDVSTPDRTCWWE